MSGEAHRLTGRSIVHATSKRAQPCLRSARRRPIRQELPNSHGSAARSGQLGAFQSRKSKPIGRLHARAGAANLCARTSRGPDERSRHHRKHQSASEVGFRSEGCQLLVSFHKNVERFNLALARFAARQANSAVSGALRTYAAKTILAASHGFTLRMAKTFHNFPPERARYFNAIRTFPEQIIGSQV